MLKKSHKITSELAHEVESQLLSSLLSQSDVSKKLKRAMMNMAPSMLMTLKPTMQVNLSKVRVNYANNVEMIGLSDVKIEPDPNYLPAVVSQSLRASGMQTVKWTDVRFLPGAMYQGILDLGMSVFKHFGMDTSGSVRTIACMDSGDLLNSNIELNAVLNFLETNAIKCSPDNMTICFDGTIDGYCPEVRLYHTKEHAYLAVLESEGISGRYLYVFDRDLTQVITQNDALRLG
jgi:hypothetical protein